MTPHCATFTQPDIVLTGLTRYAGDTRLVRHGDGYQWQMNRGLSLWSDIGPVFEAISDASGWLKSRGGSINELR